MEIEADESFKKAGAIPFQWEIRPGVPKLQHSQISPSSDQQTKQEDPHPQKIAENNQSPTIPETPLPAADFNFQRPIAEPPTRSVPGARTDRHLLTRPAMGIASDGCFPTEKNTQMKSHKTGPEPEPDYLSDLETVSRCTTLKKSITISEDSCSSKRKCYCGEIVNFFTSKTPSNPERRFYKCPKPETNSCGYWEWHDKLFSDRAVVIINNLKTQLNEATVKIDTLNMTLDAIKIKRDNLKDKMNAMEVSINFEVNKSRILEDKVLKMNMLIMILCSLFIGFIASQLMEC